MAEFNLADVLRGVEAQDLGQAGREQIQYIDIDLIDPDPKNFYELSDLDELAANIELVGLQQPLRVRVHPDDAGRWMIVSGHRRRAAIRKLVDEGKDQLRAVACIVEQPAASAALQELRLIFANSGTRKMTPAEISQQAERVEMLLYELKEQGMEFPGRMRDHVAEACKVSKSKLSRLKVIREHLIPECLHLFNINKLSEATAYALAQQDPETQSKVYRMYNSNAKMEYLSEYAVKGASEFVQALSKRKCQVNEASGCTDQQRWIMEQRYVKQSYNCYNCKTSGCCHSCPERVDCKDVCPLIGAEIRQLRQEKREKRREEIQAEKMRTAEKVDQIKAIWSRFGQLREDRGKTVKDVFDATRRYFSEYYGEEFAEKERGGGKLTETSNLPFGYLKLSDVETLSAAADLLDCSVDYLLGRTETPQPPMATLESTPVWHDAAAGDLPAEGQSVIAAVQYDVPYGIWATEDLRFQNGKFRAYGVEMPDDCRIFWQPRFDPTKHVPDSGTEESEETND